MPAWTPEQLAVAAEINRVLGIALPAQDKASARPKAPLRLLMRKSAMQQVGLFGGPSMAVTRTARTPDGRPDYRPPLEPHVFQVGQEVAVRIPTAWWRGKIVKLRQKTKEANGAVHTETIAKVEFSPTPGQIGASYRMDFPLGEVYHLADPAVPHEIRVRGHVRRTRRGVAPVRAHQRRVQGAQADLLSYQPPQAPAAPAPAPAPRKGKRIKPAELGLDDPIPAEAAQALAVKLREQGQGLIERWEGSATHEGRRENTYRQQAMAASSVAQAMAGVAEGQRLVRMADLIAGGYQPTRFDSLMAVAAMREEARGALVREELMEERLLADGHADAYADSGPWVRAEGVDLTPREDYEHEVARTAAIDGAVAAWEAAWPNLEPAPRRGALVHPEAAQDLARRLHEALDPVELARNRARLRGEDDASTVGDTEFRPDDWLVKKGDPWEIRRRALQTRYSHSTNRYLGEEPGRALVLQADALLKPLIDEEGNLPVTPAAHEAAKKASALYREAKSLMFGRAAEDPFRSTMAAELGRLLQLGWTKAGERKPLADRYRAWLARTAPPSSRAETKVVQRSPTLLPEDERMARAEKEERARWIPYDLQRIEGFVETPAPWVERMITEAQLAPGMTVLEPSAGRGGIADRLPADVSITVAEQSVSLQAVLRDKGYQPLADAMTVEGQFDRVIMNPPWERQQDIEQVQHAFEHNLRPGGILVAIVSGSTGFRQDRKNQEFNDWLSRMDHDWTPIPAEDWKRSNHQVNGRMLVVHKPLVA